MRQTVLFIYIIYLVAFKSCAAQIKDTIATSPPMGWNSWNWFGKEDINETVVYQVIDSIVAKGLKGAGYEYVIIDGGWRESELNERGELVPHKTKFPNGIKPLVEYAHSKGLKFGLHTTVGTHDCGKDLVGGLNHEETHYNQFAQWEIDFIKLDKCNYVLTAAPERQENGAYWRAGWRVEGEVSRVYKKWHELNYTRDKQILLSASAYKFYDWYPLYANMGRTTMDVLAHNHGGAMLQGHGRSIMEIAYVNNEFRKYARPGYWNDPDMLVVGDKSLKQGEQKIHFALWCIMSAPLIMGNDPRYISSDELNLFCNKNAIKINQDNNEQGGLVTKIAGMEVWIKRLKNNEKAYLLINLSEQENLLNTEIVQELSNVDFVITDVYKKKKIDFSALKKQSIPPGDCMFLLQQPK